MHTTVLAQSRPGKLSSLADTMKFCGRCGKTLSILDSSKAELCITCIQKQTAPSPAPSTALIADSDLYSAKLSCREGKIILESKEGWLLWSGSDCDLHSLKLIIDRAEKILKIRKRKSKN